MSKNYNKINNNLLEALIGLLALILLIYSSDPVLYPDSLGYLGGSLKDPPLYSTIITVMQFLFKSLNSIIILQTFFVSFSIVFLSRVMTLNFKLNISTKAFILISLFLPFIQFYNNLLTEPISYAFSLLLVSFVIKLVYKFSNINLFWFTVFVIALLLTRNQFIFLYPVILLFYLGILIVYNSKKTLALLFISFLSVLIVHNFLIFFNTYVNQNSFKNENLSYIEKGPYYFTYFDAIYISSVKDAELFENQNMQKIMISLFNAMDNQKALSSHYGGRGHFSTSTSRIKSYSDPLLKDLAIKENTSVINLKKVISFKLIKKNFKQYIKHIFKKLYDSTWLFIFLPFFMLLAATINFFKYKSKFQLVLTFLSTYALANHSVIYLFGRVQPRYLIYTDFILLIFIFIILNNFVQKK
ncbi:hypothetical protein N9K48_02570 [Candidatus Pelagibacter bacterium]|nr:hypothetical protein [Candidatus Pelagibacter bacterium]